MQPTLDVRRHGDGSIDFDFYRRRAMRLRRLVVRMLVKRCLAAASRIVSAPVAPGARPPGRDRPARPGGTRLRSRQDKLAADGL